MTSQLLVEFPMGKGTSPACLVHILTWKSSPHMVCDLWSTHGIQPERTESIDLHPFILAGLEQAAVPGSKDLTSARGRTY